MVLTPLYVERSCSTGPTVRADRSVLLSLYCSRQHCNGGPLRLPIEVLMDFIPESKQTGARISLRQNTIPSNELFVERGISRDPIGKCESALEV